MVKGDMGITAESGTYDGNGTTQEFVTGVRPSSIIIVRGDRKYIMEHFDGDISTSGQIGLGNGKVYRFCETTDGITITDTGFNVGSSQMVNENGIAYKWKAVF